MLNKIEVLFKELKPGAKVPAYGTDFAAGADLHAYIYEGVITIPPGGWACVPTGIALAIPEGWCIKIIPRSGLGAKHGIRLRNGTGLIDSDYRGELMAYLHNTGDLPFTVHHGDRIVQAILAPAPQMIFRAVGELPATDRGEGGFGSTGVA